MFQSEKLRKQVMVGLLGFGLLLTLTWAVLLGWGALWLVGLA